MPTSAPRSQSGLLAARLTKLTAAAISSYFTALLYSLNIQALVSGFLIFVLSH